MQTYLVRVEVVEWNVEYLRKEEKVWNNHLEVNRLGKRNRIERQYLEGEIITNYVLMEMS